MNAPRQKNRRLTMALRLGVTGLCGIALFSIIDPTEIWGYLSQVRGESLVAALLLHALIIILLGWRWQQILKMLSTDCRLISAVDMTFMATFFNLVLPFSIGGDVYRVLLSRRIGFNINETLPGAILDRLAGLLALGLMLLITAGLLQTSALPWELRGAMMSLLPLMLIVFWLLFTLGPGILAKRGIAYRIAIMSNNLRAAGRRVAPVLAVLIQSLLAHLLAVAIVVVIASGLDLNLSITDALLLVPVLLLAIMLPISIGGWGVRESAAVPLLALAGVPASGAVTLALLFGLTQIAAGGCGALYFFVNTTARQQRPQT